jgi:hypothetical protein
MRQTAITGTMMIVATSCAIILHVAFVSLPRAFKDYRSRISFGMAPPIETFVDWLQAAYGGPIGPDDSVSR